MNHLNRILSKEASVSSNESDASIFEESSTRAEQFSQEELSDRLRNLIFPKKLLKYWGLNLKNRNTLVLVRKSLFTAPGKANLYFHTDKGLV